MSASFVWHHIFSAFFGQDECSTGVEKMLPVSKYHEMPPSNIPCSCTHNFVLFPCLIIQTLRQSSGVPSKKFHSLPLNLSDWNLKRMSILQVVCWLTRLVLSSFCLLILLHILYVQPVTISHGSTRCMCRNLPWSKGKSRATIALSCSVLCHAKLTQSSHENQVKLRCDQTKKEGLILWIGTSKTSICMIWPLNSRSTGLQFHSTDIRPSTMY